MRKLIALTLAFLIGATPASAGILVRRAEGIVVTGADGIHYEDSSGIVVTGADSVLGLEVNGITRAPAEGVVVTGVDGPVVTGADGVVVTGADGASFRVEAVDGVSIANSEGVVVTGADGIVVTGADGSTYHPASMTIRYGDGVVVTGADGVVVTGADGVRRTVNDGIAFTGAEGVVVTGADALRMQSAQQVTATAPDGTTYSISPVGVVITGADTILTTHTNGVEIYRAQGVVITGADGGLSTGVNAVNDTGLVSVDPDLLGALVEATDDSNINAAVVYHRAVTDADIADLQRLGVTGGTRFRALPAVVVSATKEQLIEVSKLPAVRSLYGNTTLQWSAADTSRVTTGLARSRSDADLRLRSRSALPHLSGEGVAVAVIDTGIDGSHPDLAGRVLRNVKLADLQGFNLSGFSYPANVEDLRNTDMVYGHGTFVSGIIAADNKRPGGSALSGYAPRAKLVGLSAGDANLFHVLAGFDYVLQNRDALDIRVVNCSFSANSLFDANDPVNVATKMLADRGVNVVFSAGNSGPGENSLNPYAVAPWVVSVGATDERGRPASFSSRGDFGSSLFRPTIVAPGVNVVSARSGGASVTGALGLGSANDAQYIAPTELQYYTTGSGTSFTAPQVAGTIALMLEANPALTPAQVRAILARTATPLPPFYPHEVGAGMLNAHAAALAAAFPQRQIGAHRATLDRGQVQLIKEYQVFEGTLVPGVVDETALSVPEGALTASVQVAWGPTSTTNDLGLTVVSPAGERKDANAVNLPGLTGRRERIPLSKPQAGSWRVRVGHTVGLVATPQAYKGVLEVTRVEYGSVSDLDPLAGTLTFEEARQALRTFVMFPVDAVQFGASQGATRSETAAALVLGARVPLYVPARPRHGDVPDIAASNYVESAQAAPAGALFPRTAADTPFEPDRPIDRLTAAIALVRAAGLRAEAEPRDPIFVMYRDGHLIPWQWNGYVRVAVERGLVTSSETHFNPTGTFTRAELAHAMAVIQKMYAN